MDERREEAYRQHVIVAEATRKPTGWCWSYLIDGRVQGRNDISLQRDAEATLRQALIAGRARVDELERSGWR